MPKNKERSMIVNNNLGGGQIVYDNDLNKEKNNDTIETYNVSASNIEIDKLVQKCYEEFNNSEDRKLMLTGIKYYNNDSDIDSKTRYDHCGTQGKPNNKLSNAKLHKNMMRKLTRQKVNTLLGKPFSIETENENYKEILEDTYFTKYMNRKIYNLCKEAIKEGINWLNAYYDENGELCFRRVPGNQVKPFWEDREHTKLAQLIHYYEIEVYNGDEKETTTYADYYSKTGVIHYVKGDKGFERDSERPKEEGNFQLMVPQTTDIVNDKGEIVETTYKLDEEGRIVFEPQEMVWDKLPWIPLKYNEEETSLVKYIKSYQDQYEKIFSTLNDILADIPEAIKWFKGYGGADLNDLTEKIMEYRAILIDGDGDLGTLETPIDIEAFNAVLDRLRKDAYEDGGGVDMQNDNTGDKSGVGLKFLYSDLDLDLHELEDEVEVFFEWLLWFIDFDINLKQHQDFSEEEVTFKFNRTNIMNEQEMISMINSSRDMIPDSILLPKHPFVEDVSEVEDAIEEQRLAEEEEMQKEIEMYGNQPLNSNFNSPSKLPKVTSSSSNSKSSSNSNTNKDVKKEGSSKSNVNS